MLTLLIVFLLTLSAIARYSFWTQTSQEDFDAGTKTRIKTMADGTFRLEDGNWLETTTTDFNTGVIKDNINTTNNELKLASKVQSSSNIANGKPTSGNMSYTSRFVDGDNNSSAHREGVTDDSYVQVDFGATKEIYKVRVLRSAWWASAFGRLGTDTISKLQYYDGSWHDIPGTSITHSSPGIYDNTYNISPINCSKIKLYFYVCMDHYTYYDGFELYAYEKVWTTGNLRSQEKDLGTEVAFGNFYETHLSGHSYTFRARKYSGASWSNWVTVRNGEKVNLSNGSKIQYDIILTSENGSDNPIVYDVKIDYIPASGEFISQSHDCGSRVTTWANFLANHTLNGQTIEYAVRTSSYIAGLSDATWHPVVSGGLITAPVNRYVQWKATLSTTDGTKTPVVDDVTLYWDPYPDAPSLTAPGDGEWTNDNKPLFKWNFNDPYTGNTQEGFRVVIDDVDTFIGINYDSGIQDSMTSQWQFPCTMPDGTWYWECCTKNNYGLWGDTSTYRVLKVDTTPPDVPIMKTEPEVTTGDENEVSWYPVGDGNGRGGVEYYVQCSSDSRFAGEPRASEWITWALTNGSWNFTGLSDGVTYYYRVRAQDALGNRSEYSAAVWSIQDNPLITDCHASPNPFSPNDDETEDITTIYYTLSMDCTVRVKIYNSEDIPKITLIDGLSKPQGPNLVIWDGKDAAGNIVANGTYIYEVTAEDGMGNKGEKQGTVTVENLVSIVSTRPKDNGYFVIGEDKDIEITFNRHMSSSTMRLENIVIKDEDGLRMDKVNIVYVSSVTTITPLEREMEYCTRYTVGVSTGVTDYLGIPLTKATSFSFTTLIPGSETRQVMVEHKGGVVKIDKPSETFPGGSKGWYINLVKTDIRSLDKYVEGTGRRLICYGVDYSDNPKDIDVLDSPVTISIPYPSDTKDKKNLKLYFYNKDIERWELVKGSGDEIPDDNRYYVIGEVTITNTEYCIRGFVAGALVENYSNYPNPFKAGKQETTIRYELEEDAKVTISIYDLLGQLVRRIELAKGTTNGGKQGTNTVPWNGKNERGRVVANGGYHCVVEADTENGKHMKKARKIMVIK